MSAPETCDNCDEWVIEGPLCAACMDERLRDAEQVGQCEAARDAR